MPRQQEALYERQNRIRELHIPDVATVVGCGGTGFWTAFLLAMSGAEELILIDTDKIERSNMNRLPVVEDSIGKEKTKVLAEFIRLFRPDIRIECQHLKVETPAQCQLLRGSVFCCTDNLKSQQLICAYCKKNRIKYQRIGYDGTVLNVSRAFPLSFDSNTPDGYTIVPSWVVPAVLAAAMGVASSLYKEIAIMDDISKLHIATSKMVPEGIKEILIEKGQGEILDNIDDHIPNGYGLCDDCNRGDCENCSQCDDCERPDSSEEEEIKNKAREEGYKEGHTVGYNEGYDKGYEKCEKESEK
jgi:molybdopterin/thiamine biosynthesis adenylyltransferase